MNIVEREQYEREAEQRHQGRREDARERSAAGMGFWRLVLIVVFGILLSQGIAALLTAALTFIRSLSAQ